MIVNLDREDYDNLNQALVASFPRTKDIRMMVKKKLGVNINDFTNETLPVPEVIFDLTEWVESQGKYKEFIISLCEYKPDNKIFKKLCNKYFPYSLYQNNILSGEELKEIKGIFDSIDFEIIKNVCQATIKSNFKNVEDHLPNIDNLNCIDAIEKILLEQYPRRKKDNIPTILEFVQRLIHHKINLAVKDDLQEWLKVITIKNNFPSIISYQDLVEIFHKKFNSYLLIVVKDENNGLLSLSAELIPDYQENNDFELVEINLNKGVSNICTLDTINKILANFIRIAREKLIREYRYIKHNLILEIFLPYECLKESIDLQEILASGNQHKPIGYEYCFSIRCANRYLLDCFSNYGEFLINLEENWSILKTILHESVDDAAIAKNLLYLDCIDCQCNWDEMLDNWRKKQKISVNVTCSLPVDGTEQTFFLYLLKAGIPLSLWNRSPNFNCEKVKEEFNKILNLSSLRNPIKLYQSIQYKRREAHNKKGNASKYLGYHLGFLSDNPHRIPSILDYRKGGDNLVIYE